MSVYKLSINVDNRNVNVITIRKYELEKETKQFYFIASEYYQKKLKKVNLNKIDVLTSSDTHISASVYCLEEDVDEFKVKLKDFIKSFIDNQLKNITLLIKNIGNTYEERVFNTDGSCEKKNYPTIKV